MNDAPATGAKTASWPRLTARQWVGWTGLAVVAVLALALGVWRGDILEWSLDPQVPFQTYDPPPAPDYAQDRAWLLRDPASPAVAPAAVFFVSPTAYHGGDEWNQPFAEPHATAWLRRVVAPNYIAPFKRVGVVSAPLYREAGLYSRMTLRRDARDSRAFAYRDISSAFDVWLARHPNGPIVLAGVEQGGELTERLLRERVSSDATLRSRVAAVYLIDTLAPLDRFGGAFPPCRTRAQAGCVIGWMAVDQDDDLGALRRLRRALVWDDRGRLVDLGDRAALCVNPVSGGTTAPVSSAREHQGGANATGLEWSARPALQSRLVDARCEGGLLRFDLPKTESFQRPSNWFEQRLVSPFNIFYADIEADVQARVAAWRGACPVVSPDRGDPAASRTAPPAPGSPGLVC